MLIEVRVDLQDLGEVNQLAAPVMVNLDDPGDLVIMDEIFLFKVLLKVPNEGS